MQALNKTKVYLAESNLHVIFSYISNLVTKESLFKRLNPKLVHSQGKWIEKPLEPK
jgi:hypothetical protein